MSSSIERVRGSLKQSGATIELRDGATEEVTLSAGSNVAAVTVTLPASTDTLIGRATTDTLTNKTFDADGTGNSLTNIEDANIKASAAIDVTKLSGGTVSNTEFDFLNGVTSQLAGNTDTATLTNKTITDGSNNISASLLTSGTIPDARVPSSAVTQHVASIDHDSLLNFVATEHIDWTFATVDFTTTGMVSTGDVITTGNISVTGTVDGRDVAADGTAQDSHIAASTGVHGVTGSVVGTTDTQTLTNKTIDADSNTITNIEDADIKTGAAIARNKLDNGTADHVLVNNGSGVISSEAQLAITRGGTGASTATAAFDALAPTTTNGDIIYNNGTNNIRLGAGANGEVLTLAGGVPTWATPGSGISAIGTIDSQTKAANGAVISGSDLVLQTADASNPGLVSTAAQTFAGDKTFNDDVGIGTSTINNRFVVDGGTATTTRIQLTADGPGNGVTDGAAWGWIDSGANEGVFFWNYENSLMRIGTNNTERIRIEAGGDVGIGETDPTTRLHVTDSVTGGSLARFETSISTDEQFATVDVGNGATNVAGMGVKFESGGSVAWYRHRQQDGTVSFHYTDNNNVVRITNTFANVGTTSGTAVGSQTSDSRLKENVVACPYGLTEVLALSPKKFNYTYDTDSTNHLGFLAQDVLTEVPESVHQTADTVDGVSNFYTMNYAELTPVLVKAIQELEARVATLESA